MRHKNFFDSLASRVSVIHVYEVVITVLAIALAEPTLRSIYIGIFASALGLFLRIWARGFDRKHHELRVFGPYRYVRHPHHLGTFLLLLGYCLAARSSLVTFIMLSGCILLFRHIFREEGALLGSQGGTSYKEYRMRVPTFVPNLTPYRGPLYEKRHFSLRRAILKGKKREFETLVAALIMFLVMFGLTKIADPFYWQLGLSMAAFIYGLVSLKSKVSKYQLTSSV